LIKPQVFTHTEIVNFSSEDFKERNVLVVEILEGISKPYKDKNGTIWIKQGSDKTKLTDNNEQIRLFEQSGILYVDEMIIPQTSIDDVEFSKVEQYVSIVHNNEREKEVELTVTLLSNLNILKDSRLTLAGLLFFSKNPQQYRPAFTVKAISFFGNSIGGTDYRSSQDVEGTIPKIFEETIRFFTSNLHHIQAGQNFNSIGKLEVSKIALEELIQNALVHRDYSKNAPIRVMIFDNRIEIVSPGSLPNSLTVENIKLGNAVVRNNQLVSYCSKLMLYRGFGSGITRAIREQPNVELYNDVEGEQFRVVIPRPEKV
jgi:predicted HTH transcriptional regulator